MDSTVRALVLGGSGFVGRHVCAAFAAAGAEVIAVSRTITELPGTRTIRLDLADTDPWRLGDLLAAAAPTVVVNAAGRVWGVYGDELVSSNVTLVDRVVQVACALPRPVRLIHIGSVHEYGPVPFGQPIDERTPPRPVDPYGRTKLIGSQRVLDACAAGRLDAVVLRVGNVTGPDTPAGSLLGRAAGQLAEAARNGEPAVLRLAPLRSRRDFVDVRDVARAITAAATAPVRGAVVNIGRGEAVSVRWLVHALIEASGLPARVEERADPAGNAHRGTGIDWQQIDPSAARRLLGWQPRLTLRESLRALWEACAAATGVLPRSTF